MSKEYHPNPNRFSPKHRDIVERLLELGKQAGLSEERARELRKEFLTKAPGTVVR